MTVKTTHLNVKGYVGLCYLGYRHGQPKQQRFTIRRGVLSGTSSRRCGAISGHPVPERTDFGVTRSSSSTDGWLYLLQPAANSAARFKILRSAENCTAVHRLLISCEQWETCPSCADCTCTTECVNVGNGQCANVCLYTGGFRPGLLYPVRQCGVSVQLSVQRS